jgi:hypothetical protein
MLSGNLICMVYVQEDYRSIQLPVSCPAIVFINLKPAGMNINKASVFLIIIFSFVIISCAYVKKDVVQIPCTIADSVTYTKDIAPIIQTNCFQCHGGTSNISGILLESYTELKFYADNGYLYGTLSHSSGFIPMPDGGAKLNDCTISTIKKWIDTGTPEN